MNEDNKKDESKKSDEIIVLERYKMEQSQDLHLLNAMAEVGSRVRGTSAIEARKMLAEKLGISWGEYRRIVRKYRVILQQASESKEFPYPEQAALMLKEMSNEC